MFHGWVHTFAVVTLSVSTLHTPRYEHSQPLGLMGQAYLRSFVYGFMFSFNFHLCTKRIVDILLIIFQLF